MIYYICNCPKDIKIPINDFQAYKMFESMNHVYNKKWIAESQDVLCGEKTPSKYPVIVRPIINLYGMGKGTYYLTKNKSLDKNYFWTEILKGNHISLDVFYNKHGIQKTIAFRGYPGKLFTFLCWEYLPNYAVPDNIIDWIKINMKCYKGVFNIEIIGNKIIECHLRMGDLNQFQSEKLTNEVIKCYKNMKISRVNLPKIYLIPIFVEKNHYKKLKKEDIWYCSRITNTRDIVLNYFIDPPPSNTSNPIGGDRICNLTVTDVRKGFILKKAIVKYFKTNY
tara:strand:- start:87 stop:926 length:840 start_codon:yes stop_codon:yes gene_type:complete